MSTFSNELDPSAVAHAQDTQSPTATEQHSDDAGVLQEKAEHDVADAHQVQNEVSILASHNAQLVGNDANSGQAPAMSDAQSDQTTDVAQSNLGRAPSQAHYVRRASNSIEILASDNGPDPAEYLSQAQLNSCHSLADIAKLYSSQSNAANQTYGEVTLKDHLPDRVLTKAKALAKQKAQDNGASKKVAQATVEALFKRLSDSGKGSLSTIATELNKLNDNVAKMKKLCMDDKTAKEFGNSIVRIHAADPFSAGTKDYRALVNSKVLQQYPDMHVVADSTWGGVDRYTPSTEPNVGNPKNWEPIVERLVEQTIATNVLGRIMAKNQTAYGKIFELENAREKTEKSNPAKEDVQEYKALKLEVDELKSIIGNQTRHSDLYTTSVREARKAARTELARITNGFQQNPTGRQLWELLENVDQRIKDRLSTL